jgi:hypothetical protein
MDSLKAVQSIQNALKQFRRDFGVVPAVPPRFNIDAFREETPVPAAVTDHPASVSAYETLVAAMDSVNRQLDRCTHFQDSNSQYLDAYLSAPLSLPLIGMRTWFRGAVQAHYKEAIARYDRANVAFDGFNRLGTYRTRRPFDSLKTRIDGDSGAMRSAAQSVRTRNELGIQFSRPIPRDMVHEQVDVGNRFCTGR